MTGGGWRWCGRLTAAATAAFVLAVVLGPAPIDSQFRSVVVSPIGIPALGDLLIVVNQVALGATVLGVLVAAASLVVRFRRAEGVERQQLRWISLAAAPVSLAALTVPAALVMGNLVLFSFVLGVCVAVLPLAIGAAILRYRLYDLDRIVSRTLAYSALTVLLGGGYAAVVLGFGQLLRGSSSLVVAGATLTLAAVFQSARRRVGPVMPLGEQPPALLGDGMDGPAPATGRLPLGGGQPQPDQSLRLLVQDALCLGPAVVEAAAHLLGELAGAPGSPGQHPEVGVVCIYSGSE